jgi:hypothetical protein
LSIRRDYISCQSDAVPYDAWYIVDLSTSNSPGALCHSCLAALDFQWTADGVVGLT